MSPHPTRPDVTLTIDGLDVTTPDGTLLVDAAQQSDIEIPVFCYDPKLGDPVGACRMCLVEIEGIPKLQTACSTPVHDGMVAYTRNDRVKESQSAVVEFLLVNHPLDCPVCDKGGECPLQDVAMGWGPGASRMTDPKRHFQKPIELSPLVKIDRERCIVCYRCVRFSQEVAEDEQLQLLDRGDRTFVGTFDERPYVAPFHGNIIELCPVGALTSQAYRFRARPWDVEDAGSICTLCPSQCNVLFTVRDERVERVLGRDNNEVDDGWLCDKGRFGYEMFGSSERVSAPRVRKGRSMRTTSWNEALDRLAEGLERAGSATAAIVGGGSSNEEGYLTQRLLRGALGSPHVASGAGRALPRNLLLETARPELAARTSDLDHADAILVLGCDPMHSMPILDLRIRKAVRRAGAKLLVASERPTALDGGVAIETQGALAAARYAPGDAAAFIAALIRVLSRGRTILPIGAERFAEYEADARAIAGALRDSEEVVVVWGERIARGPVGVQTLEALLALAERLKLARTEGAGMLEVPDATNARGLREVGCAPGIGPGLGAARRGKDAAGIRDGLAKGELKAIVLWDVDPVRDFPDSGAWGRALEKADFVVSVSMFKNESSAYADVHLPAESHAEKEGTLTHPDGRLQRLRPGVPHPDGVRPLWQAQVELLARLGDETGFQSGPDVLGAIAAEVPFYEGITHEEIGGTGIRWQEREAGKNLAKPGRRAGGGKARRSPARSGLRAGKIPLGGRRDLWASDATEHNPALRYLVPAQTLELAPSDAEALGVGHGDRVDVASNGASVTARVAIRERLRPGAAFLIEGTRKENANAVLTGNAVEVRPR
jgi:NADH-quinone oxidoreductase subunit G